MRVKYLGKEIEIDLKEVSLLNTGLMLRGRNTRNLLFSFSKYCKVALTAWFVFFPFLVLWLDDKNRVLEHKLVRPFQFHIIPKENFKSIVEIPVNSKNSKIIEFFVGKRNI